MMDRAKAFRKYNAHRSRDGLTPAELEKKEAAQTVLLSQAANAEWSSALLLRNRLGALSDARLTLAAASRTVAMNRNQNVSPAWRTRQAERQARLESRIRALEIGISGL